MYRHVQRVTQHRAIFTRQNDATTVITASQLVSGSFDDSILTFFSPEVALLRRIHRRRGGTVERLREVARIGERSDSSELSQGVSLAEYLIVSARGATVTAP